MQQLLKQPGKHVRERFVKPLPGDPHQPPWRNISGLSTIRRANYFVHPADWCVLSGADEKTIQRSGEFGLSLGICYQVFDDLIDTFEKPENSDKSLGSDLKTGKMTLPFILLRQAVTLNERLWLDNFIQASDTTLSTDQQKHKVLSLFEKYHTLSASINFLEQNFSHTNTLLNGFSNISLKKDLRAFLCRFTDKFSKLSFLKTSNFLAV